MEPEKKIDLEILVKLIRKNDSREIPVNISPVESSYCMKMC